MSSIPPNRANGQPPRRPNQPQGSNGTGGSGGDRSAVPQQNGTSNGTNGAQGSAGGNGVQVRSSLLSLLTSRQKLISTTGNDEWKRTSSFPPNSRLRPNHHHHHRKSTSSSIRTFSFGLRVLLSLELTHLSSQSSRPARPASPSRARTSSEELDFGGRGDPGPGGSYAVQAPVGAVPMPESFGSAVPVRAPSNNRARDPSPSPSPSTTTFASSDVSVSELGSDDSFLDTLSPLERLVGRMRIRGASEAEILVATRDYNRRHGRSWFWMAFGVWCFFGSFLCFWVVVGCE